jgi:hypothetical protein
VGADPAALPAAVTDAVQSASATLPSGSTYRLLTRARFEGFSADSGFDVIVELEVPDGGSLESFGPFVEQFGRSVVGSIEPSRSGAAAGTEYTLVEGDGALRIVYYLHPKQGWSNEDFWSYWLDPHSAYGPVLSDAPYRQFHNTERELAASFASSFGGSYVDGGGAVHRFYADAEDMALTSQDRDPDLVQEGSEDTASFVDLARDTGGPFTVEFERVAR